MERLTEKFDEFLKEGVLNEGEIKVDVPMTITYSGSMFQEQAQNMGDSEQNIATMMAADIGLVSGSMEWTADRLVIAGYNSDMDPIDVMQSGEYNMYGGPYTPKMGKFKVTVGKKNVVSAIKKAFKSYGGWEEGEDLGRTDIWGGITNGKKEVKY